MRRICSVSKQGAPTDIVEMDWDATHEMEYQTKEIKTSRKDNVKRPMK